MRNYIYVQQFESYHSKWFPHILSLQRMTHHFSKASKASKASNASHIFFPQTLKNSWFFLQRIFFANYEIINTMILFLWIFATKRSKIREKVHNLNLLFTLTFFNSLTLMVVKIYEKIVPFCRILIRLFRLEELIKVKL